MTLMGLGIFTLTQGEKEGQGTKLTISRQSQGGKNCLLLISYHRVTQEYTVVWRTTELSQRWAADLFWISSLLPGKKLNLIIPYCYQTIQVWAGTAEALGLRPWSGKAKKRYKEVYKWARDLYYSEELSPDNLSTWSPVKISQKAVLRSRGVTKQ